MSTKPTKKNQESESLQEQIIKLEKQLESFKHSNDHFLKNKLFLHYDIKEPEKVVVDCETKLPVLAEVEKKKIQKGKEEDPTHLIIEGDNYHALSVLNYTHAGKIDLIYIDPPYNTGHDDFIYNDCFVDREDSFRHSKWLSFMAHRLRLAKNLLADTGVIFISIDDNEQAHLRLLCDQIFGEENFVNTIIWQRASGGGNAKGIVTGHDYVLVYQKNASILIDYRGDKVDATRFAKNKIKVIEGKTYFLDDDVVRKVFGKYEKGVERRCYYEELEKYKSPDTVVEIKTKIKSGEYVLIPQKNGKNFIGKYIEADTTKKLYSIIQGVLNNQGKEDLQNLGISDEMFSYPKPVLLMEKLIASIPADNLKVLDFFAGSGTTGHAVLKLNAQDGGMRQFILCSTNDEKEPIVDKVLYPRIKKVIDGYGDNAPIPVNLRYFQTDFVEKKGSVSQLKIDLTRKCAEMLCVRENVFETVKPKKSAKNYRFFKNGDKYLGVFFDFFTDPEFTDFIAELNKLPQEAEKVVYIFVLDGSASIFAEEFAGVANCEIKEIPQKILDIYKQLAREVARK